MNAPLHVSYNKCILSIASTITQTNLYPGTGKLTEAGRGDGEGATLNLPLPGLFLWQFQQTFHNRDG